MNLYMIYMINVNILLINRMINICMQMHIYTTRYTSSRGRLFLALGLRTAARLLITAPQWGGQPCDGGIMKTEWCNEQQLACKGYEQAYVPHETRYV